MVTGKQKILKTLVSLLLLIQLKLSLAQREACQSGAMVLGNNGYNGYLWSPNYPELYNNSITCQWRIVAYDPAVTTSIRLSFLDFNTEPSSDYVRVYDGDSAAAPLLLSHSGSSLPSTNLLVSSGNSMLVTFTSDVSASSTGWRAAFSSDPACMSGGVRYVSFGELVESPFYPYTYPINTECVWSFLSLTGVTDFEFHTYDFQLGSNCADNLEVHVDGVRKIRYCAFQVEERLTDNGSAMKVVFKSDGVINSYNGFRFKVVQTSEDKNILVEGLIGYFGQ